MLRPFWCVARIHREKEHRRGDDDEPALETRLEELLHKLSPIRPGNRFYPRLRPRLPRIFLGRLHPPEARMLLHKNPDPQKHARLGHVRTRKPARRNLPLEQLEQKVAPALVVKPQAAHPAVEARKAPAGEQERDERLREAGRVLGGEVDVANEVGLERRLGCDPAETEAWGHDLAEATDRT